jgi:hypothetical protein
MINGGGLVTYRMACLYDYALNLEAALADVNSEINPTFFADASKKLHSSGVKSASELEIPNFVIEIVKHEISNGEGILPDQYPPIFVSKLLEMSRTWAQHSSNSCDFLIAGLSNVDFKSNKILRHST